MEDRLKILARAEYVHRPDGETPQFCRLRPLLRAIDSEWIPIEDAVEAFPTQGTVFWWGPPSHIEDDSFWSLDVVENDGEERPDHFQVRRGEEPLGFLRPEGIDGPELRRRIAHGKFRLKRPPTVRMYVGRPGHEEEWVGPLRFGSKTREGYWRVEDVPRGFVDIVSIPDEALTTIPESRSSFLVLKPGQSVPPSTGKWNVQDDSTLLSSLLKNLRRLDESVADAFETTQQVWRGYADTLAGEDGDELAHDRARIVAVRELLDRHGEDITANEELFEVLLEHPDIQRRLDDAIDLQVAESSDEVAERLRGVHSELFERKEELEKSMEALESELEEKRRQLQEVSDNLTHEREALDETTGELRQRLEAIVREIEEDPIRSLSQSVVIQSLLRTQVNAQPVGSAAASELSKRKTPPESVSVEDLEAVRADVQARAIASGLHRHVGSSILGGWLAGRFVACRGNDSLQLVTGLAALMAGNNVWIVPLRASLFGLQDLLSLPASNISPEVAPMRLGDLLRVKDSEEYPTAIVLNGLNRAPPAQSLTDLMDGIGGSVGGLPWERDGAIDVVSAQDAARVLWAGTMQSGRTTWKLDAAVASHMHIVDADRFTEILPEHRPEPKVTRSRVPSHVLAEHEAIDATPSLPSAIHEYELEISKLCWATDDPSIGLAEWIAARTWGPPLEGDVKLILEQVGGPVTSHYSDLSDSIARVRRMVDRGDTGE